MWVPHPFAVFEGWERRTEPATFLTSPSSSLPARHSTSPAPLRPKHTPGDCSTPTTGAHPPTHVDFRNLVFPAGLDFASLPLRDSSSHPLKTSKGGAPTGWLGIEDKSRKGGSPACYEDEIRRFLEG